MRVFTYCGGCKKYVWEMVGVGCPDCVQRIKDKAERNRKLLEDIERLEQEDYPFSLILEHRSSIREYDAHPITDRQLGEFLYRTARVKELIKSDIPGRQQAPLSRRRRHLRIGDICSCQ